MAGSPLQHLQAALNQRYQVERELGHGGMATVYLATDLKLHRQVALKVLRPELAASLGNERFLREIEIAARLSHPHILPLHDSGDAGGHLYYAMPYVEGESLRQRLEREGQLPIPEVIAIVRAVASALTYAHRHGVVHRDIKPENILLSKDSEGGAARPLVADFGIARALDAAGGERLTETGLALGTPAYMSPEQAASDRLDGRSDIYALGCVAYEMLAGQPPFTGPTAQAILARHAVDPVPSLHTVRATIPAAVEAAIERALAKVPADRFTTADHFAQALSAEHGRALLLRRRLTRRARLALGLGVGVAAAGGTMMLRGSSSAVIPLAATIAVMPFSGGGDTALTRLGKDLAITISASLDGVGEIQTADRLRVAQEAATDNPVSVAQAAAIARRVGASSLLRGTLVRAGDRVRLDAQLHSTEGLEPVTEGITVIAHRDSIGALTDSTSWTLLRQIWRRGEAPSPSLAAITTSSLPALRAFLIGERHIEKDEWRSAALSYRSAIAADSTFWLAYYRYVLARSWNEEDIEPGILNSLHINRTVLPDRERLLVEALAEDSMPREIELLRAITLRFPDYWPGWFHYGDWLYHYGPLLGYRWKDAQQALGRAVALNRRLKPAFHHLFWNSAGKDSAEMKQALDLFQALPGSDPLVSQAQLASDLRLMRLLQLLDWSRGGIRAADMEFVDSVARFSLTPAASEFQRDVYPVSFLWAWNPAAQVEFNRRILRYAPDGATAGVYRGTAWAWAERGDWDSALAAIDEAARRQPNPIALGRYALTVLGAWLGAVSPEQAMGRRRWAHAMVSEIAESKRRSELLGHLAWLDGLLAYVTRDRTALQRARADARRSGRPHADIIDRSLGAFDTALSGDRSAAARELIALEQRCAGSYWDHCGETTLPNIAAHRLSAATWLLEAGDTAQAAQLLIWHEARWFPWFWSFVTRPLAYLMLARIEEAQGNIPSANEHYAQFLRHYDSPMPGQRHLVEEAQAALERLSGRNDPSVIP